MTCAAAQALYLYTQQILLKITITIAIPKAFLYLDKITLGSPTKWIGLILVFTVFLIDDGDVVIDTLKISTKISKLILSWQTHSLINRIGKIIMR